MGTQVEKQDYAAYAREQRGISEHDQHVAEMRDMRQMRDLVKTVAPILEILAGIFGSTSGAARSSFSAMLMPLILAGALTRTSDAIGHPASHIGGNQGAGTLKAMKEVYENRKQALAEELSEAGMEVKKVPPEPQTAIAELKNLKEEQAKLEDALPSALKAARRELKEGAALADMIVTEKAGKATAPKAAITKYLNELDAKLVISEKVRLTEYKGTKQEEAATTSRNIKLERDVITDLQGQGITDLSQCKGVASLLTGQYQTLDQLQKDRREMMMFFDSKNGGTALKQVNLNIAEAELNIKTTLERNNLNSMEVSKYSLEKTAPVAPAAPVAPEAAKSIFSHLVSWISSKTITQLKTLV